MHAAQVFAEQLAAVALGQFESERHWTQAPVAVLQYGVEVQSRKKLKDKENSNVFPSIKGNEEDVDPI